MSQLKPNENPVPSVTSMKPPLFATSESRQHDTSNNSAQGDAVQNGLAMHHTISGDDSASESSPQYGLQALQAAALAEGLSETDWMVFDKEAADSDRDTIENMSIGDFQMPAETLEPAKSLAQQDYEMQLRLLEAQNRRRLEMARQEQDRLNIQRSQMPMRMKGPHDLIPSAEMGSMQRNPIEHNGNKMGTLPPRAPSFGPGPGYHPVNMSSMAMKPSGMPLLQYEQPVGRYNPESAYNGNAHSLLKTTPGKSSSQSDPMIPILQKQMKALEYENQVLRRQLKATRGINFEIFHCILGREGEGIYLDNPYWVKSGGNLQLKADSPVLYPDAYILYKSLAFVVYKYYSADIPAETREALQQKSEMPDPEPNSEVIKLISEEMIGAIKAFVEKDQVTLKKFPCLSVEKELQAPYLWWYYYRDRRNFLDDVPQPQAELIRTLTSWIDDNYGDLYSRANGQFRRGMVSAASARFLIQPGDVLIRTDEEGAEAYLATSWFNDEKRSSHIRDSLGYPKFLASGPSPKKSEGVWEVDAWSYGYNGDFYQLMRRFNIQLDADTPNAEIPIVDLDVFPLRFASQELLEALKRRGKTFWNCRNGKYVSYNNRAMGRDYTPGQRYVIDCHTYNKIQDTARKDAIRYESRMESTLQDQEEAPSEPDVYLFPRTIIGYDLRRKKWEDLNVDLIQDVSWNKHAFNHLVADPEMKELVQALVTNKVAADRGTDLMQNKGNGPVMLLHGGPGTGKTFTAESVAEWAERPLYPVACGDIGTKPEDVEKYLESVFQLSKIWGCVVVLDEAEVFLEQSYLNDSAHNALVSVFLRTLERYDGVLILTSNRVGTFDDAFKSRIQLALHYESLTQPQRAQIWRNFFSHLKSLDEENIDFDDIDGCIGELSEREMNGHQICNLITTARQLAQFQGKRMTASHLMCVIKATGKFDPYVSKT